MNLQDQDEYAKAFNAEPNIPADDAPEGESGDTSSAVMLADEKPEDGAAGADAGEAQAEPTEAAPEAEAPAPAAEPEMSPEDEQRAKSWEGRLKAMEKALKQKEAELAAREAALGQPGETQALADGGEVKADDEDADTIAEGETNGAVSGPGVQELADGGPAAGDDVESIKSEAMELAADPVKLAGVLKTMIADYGRDFVVGAVALAGPLIDAKAEGYVNDVNGSLEDLISDIQSAFSGLHKSSIADAHEDFEEVVEGEEFKAWINSLDEAAKAKAEQVVEGGSAGQVVKLLGQFKQFIADRDKPKAKTPDDIWAEDAAASVRSSSPLQIPSRAPMSKSDEYKKAFEAA